MVVANYVLYLFLFSGSLNSHVYLFFSPCLFLLGFWFLTSLPSNLSTRSSLSS